MSTRLSAAELPSGATLTILADSVQVAPLGAADFVDALPGQSLSPGDVVRTGDTGIALLTFFDGSESQLSAGSLVQIEQADYAPAPQIALYQSSGVSVNRVIPLPPGGSFRTDTPDATGLVRGTSYVVTVANDEDAVGTAVTLLTDRDGHVGHVQVVPPVATTPSDSVPAEAIVDLVHAGDLGSASVAAGAARPTASHLDDVSLATLEQAARNLRDTAGARVASDQARQTLRSVAPAPAQTQANLATAKVDATAVARSEATPVPTRVSKPTETSALVPSATCTASSRKQATPTPGPPTIVPPSAPNDSHGKKHEGPAQTPVPVAVGRSDKHLSPDPSNGQNAQV